ncbi:acyloxyacyl hydrolase [Ramlibacter humi]|uniref:Acyloxyacyl hydrolase n=1 Tax=Ramlibacter humi TaxID=2530451 RepID=A0A4Z0BST9_9BURK|nr:acyloxyacyl hydrolase [Ramlibacter humi]TFZ01901.1 acyloxyacyl hydrolase [Ramlibacter humi]
MPRSARIPCLAAVLLAGALPLAAFAQDWRPATVFVQGGPGPKDGLKAVTVGAQWPWVWRSEFAGGEFTGATEVFLSGWRADAPGGGHRTYAQLGLVPMFRWRPAQAPWFVEAGIGLSVLDKQYVTANRVQSSEWNFSDNLALGYDIGKGSEVSLRWQHSSNGGARKPNPGINLYAVRYAVKF